MSLKTICIYLACDYECRLLLILLYFYIPDRILADLTHFDFIKFFIWRFYFSFKDQSSKVLFFLKKIAFGCNFHWNYKLYKIHNNSLSLYMVWFKS